MASVSGIKAGRAFILIEALDRTGKVLDGIKHKLGRYAADISRTGTTMALRAAAALTPVALATRTYAAFDDSMKRVEARSQGTAAEMVKLRDQAKELGRTTAFTATQIGILQDKLAQKGFDRAPIEDMTKPIMNLARAGGTGEDLGLDAANSAELVGGTLRAMSMEADQATHVADLMTAALNGSNYSLEELMVSMSYAAPTAKRFGVSLEDTLAILGAMRDLNIDASIAGTAFRNMLNYMSKEAERSKFNEKLSEMTGSIIEFTDEKHNLHNIRDILLAINDVTKDLGSAQSSELYDMLFETRAAVPAGAVGRSSDRMAEMLTMFSDVSNLSERTANKMESGLGGSFREIESATEGVAIAIGESLESSLMTLERTITRTLGVVTEWIKGNEGLVVGIVAIIAAIGLLGLGMIIAGQAVMTLVTPLLALITLLTGSTALLLAFVAPWAAAAAAIYLAARAIADFGGNANKFHDSIQAGTESTVNYMADKWGSFVDYFEQVGTNLVNFWNDVIKSIAKALQRGDIETAAKILWAALKVQWTKGTNDLLDIMDAFTLVMKSALSGGTQNPFISPPNPDPNAVNLEDLIVRSVEMSYGYGPGEKVDPEGYGGGPVNAVRKWAEHSKGTAARVWEDAQNKDSKLVAENSERMQERERQLDILEKQLKELQDANEDKDKPPSITDNPAMDSAYMQEILKAKMKDLIGVDEITAQATGTPDVLTALEKGSIDAFKAFQENKMKSGLEAKVDKLIEVAKGSAESLRRIDENLASTETDGGTV